ncbi:Spermine/spermidine synthase family protein [Penicillium hispanicum]|uniref:Spermine/spermidine synthase family protein n=1 Tax=Penicillium hispanicum TaxID=1080232 RepID=UPI002540DD8B|nr:Spermine/spermidine synthase family protein [Penicillium hispanicum]KAJ5573984.1 Spermine/spermidine synthase family protein [Penicillium hispanicum]
MSVEQFVRQIDAYRLGTGVALLFLAAFYSPVMVLVLSPVYGSLPAHIFHGYGVAIFAGAGWFLKDQIQKRLGRLAAYMLPVLAFWTPTLQYFLMQQSSKLGNPAGPVITELCGYYPLLLLTVAIAGKQIQAALNLESQGDLVVEHVPLLGSYLIYSFAEHLAKSILSYAIGFTVVFSRAGMQLIIAVLYSVIVPPSKLLVLVVPSLLFSLTSDVHLGGIGGVNSALQAEGFTLLARQESYTGYLSVLEDEQNGFRVMRCDHSLLGGQWTKLEPAYRPKVEDPIYAVFVMLEAVRLVEPDDGSRRVDADSKALVIGLGIGTTPAALMKHGIDTTIVELDPVVHKFATEYFNLPSNHVAAIEDATKFVQRAHESTPSPQYDYIIHDVFTGGAEPAELFTIEFLKDLGALLKDDGVIAINYAGDLTLYPTGLVVRTIQAVFPSCRIFREHAVSQDEANPNFTNMVLFCKKSSSTPVRFRDPVPNDFLRSSLRETHLVPKHELDPSMFATIPERGRRFLVAKEVGRLHKFQDRGALEHWEIMREVLPHAVWENW